MVIAGDQTGKAMLAAAQGVNHRMVMARTALVAQAWPQRDAASW